MLDNNGREIRTGDFLTISGAYFKNSNGVYLVTNASDAPDYCGDSVYLHKVKKNGELCIGNYSTESLPMGYYCSDWKKNKAAKEHDKINLRYEVTDGIPTYYAAKHFRKKVENYTDQFERSKRNGSNEVVLNEIQARIDYYRAAANRLSESAVEPKQKEPKHGIKFYYNGIKVDGGRLIPCHYSIDNSSRYSEGVTIYAREYSGDLPTKYFVVKNNSDGMTDYFETDRAEVPPSHPLYRFVRYNALKARAKGEEKRIESIKAQLNSGKREPWPGHYDSLRTSLEQAQKYIDEYKNTKDPGQPTADDIQAVEDMKTAAESARLAAEHAEQLRAREETLKKISEGRHYCESIAAQYPIVDGQPTVEIGFSESPYLYSLSHGANNIFSVAAAEIVFEHYDKMFPEHSGYDKTDFIVRWTDEEFGEECTYEGRYDIGDHENSLIEHIRSFGRWCRTHDRRTGAELAEPPEELSDNEKLADYLEQYTKGGRIVSVEVNQDVIGFVC